MYDIAVIGGGVVGCSLAYLLSRYQLKIVLLEKENDVALGASRANSAIIHAGYDPEPDTQMAELNVEGVELCTEYVRRLDVEYVNTGSLVVALTPEDDGVIKELYDRGEANGVPGQKILSARETKAMEPNLADTVSCSLYAPSAGIVNPWEYTLAFAEVAARNGVEISLDSEVCGLEKIGGTEGNGFEIHYFDRKNMHLSPKSEEAPVRSIKSRYVVNAAGVYADKIHAYLEEPRFKINPTRGEYYLLDRQIKDLVKTVVFQCPGVLGKGVLIAPTVHENIIIGPNAEVLPDHDDTSTTAAGLDYVAEMARRSVPNLPLFKNIKNFAGLRANSNLSDFAIEMLIPGFLDLAAIKSPGLTSAPAISKKALRILRENGLETKEKSIWDGGRKVMRFKTLTPVQKRAAVTENPSYGRIICRCEKITEGEIIDAAHREITPVSLDAIKRRCGTGMGRCQGGFCGPRVLEILARETGKKATEILANINGSYVLTGETKSADHEVSARTLAAVMMGAKNISKDKLPKIPQKIPHKIPNRISKNESGEAPKLSEGVEELKDAPESEKGKVG